MAANPASKIMRYIRDLAEAEVTKGLSDGQLLARFVQEREEAAFAGLVKRHGRLVWGVCRHLLGTEQDAEDAFQATFLVLARRPGSIRKAEALGSWLHGVAYRVAIKAMKNKRKRQAHERRAPAASAAQAPSDLACRELQAVLDEEVRRLPEKYRAPFILCCLEGRTREDVSKELGWNEGTVSSRIARARRLLQERLTRRGVTLSAALCAGDLWTNTAAASLPTTLAANTIKAACGAAVGTAFEGASAGAVALAEGIMRAMTLAKWQVGAILFLAVGLSATTAALWGRQTPAASAPGTKPAEAVAPAIVVKKDLYGDALPQGAVARLGTVRQRAPGAQLAVTADGKEVVTVDPDLTVRRFDAATGELRATRQLPTTNSARLGKLSPRGRFVVLQTYPSTGFELELWDVTDQKRLRTLSLAHEHHTWDENGFAFSPDESLVAIADHTPRSDSHRVSLWDLKTSNSRILWSWKNLVQSYPFQPVVAFSPDGKRLVGCHFDRILRCWEVEGGKLLWESERQINTGLILFSADSKTVTTDCSGLCWDAATGKLDEKKYQPPKEAVYPVAVSPDGRFIAFEDGFEGIVLWKPGEAKASFRLPPPGPRARSGHYTLQQLPNNIIFTPDGKGVIRRQGPLQRWDVETGKPMYARTESWGHMDKVTNAIFSPDGRHLASCSADETVRLWDRATGRILHVFPRGRSDRLAFTPDGKHFLTLANYGAHNKNGLRQWDVATGIQVRDFKLPEPEFSLVGHYSNDTDLRVTADAKKVFLLNWTQKSHESILTTWDAATGVLVAQKPIARSDHSVLTPDGGSVLTLNNQIEGVMLLDTASAKPRWHLQTDRVKDPRWRVRHCDLAMSPGGRFMAVHMELVNQIGREFLYDDMRVGDMSTGRQLAKLAAAGHAVFTFSPDDRLFAVAAADIIRLWETASWQEVGSIRAAGDPSAGRINSITFSPAGRTLATGHADSTILLWDATLRAGAQGGMLTAAEADALWADLAGSNAPRAYTAIWRLVDDPERAISLIKEHLKATLAPPPEIMRPLLSDLDSDQFQKRDTAKQKLQVLGELAEPALRSALKANPSLEMRRRLEALLERLSPSRQLKGEALRGVRAIQILERIGTSEARSILERLDQGLESASLTRAAKESLARMAPR